MCSLYRGLQSEEQQRMGERLAFYAHASKELSEAAKLAKGIQMWTGVRSDLV